MYMFKILRLLAINPVNV
uniref:Uncharacterized protein n=1 Tax=Anguilla anguilla TaxID=7936 RepID=A0A0E9QQ97_ANGAN